MTTYTCFTIKKPRNRVYLILHNVVVHYYDCTDLEGYVDYYVNKLKRFTVKLPLYMLDCEEYCHLCKLNTREGTKCCFNTRYFFYAVYNKFDEKGIEVANNWREDPSRQDLSIFEIDYLITWINTVKCCLDLDKELKGRLDPELLRRIEREFKHAIKQIELAYELEVETCYNI